MSSRYPILAVALVAACVARQTPTSPGAEAPASDAPPIAAAEPEPAPAPVEVAEAPPAVETPAVETPPAPQTPPVAPDTPAAVTIAVASVHLLQDCPDDQATAEAKGPRGRGSASSSDDESQMQQKSVMRVDGKPMPPPPPGCLLNLSLTNSGGREGQIRVERVRVLEGKRELARVVSRKPTRWNSEAYVPWDERVPGNATTQVAYSLANAQWKRGSALDLAFKPYVVEVVVTIDGRKQTVRSAEFVPVSHDMIQT